MADYLPLQIFDIKETIVEEGDNKGEIRKTAVCRTVQPEQVNLNLSKLDAARLQKIIENKGNILMIPIRRGEFNGRAFTTIADGHIFRDSDVVATFSLSDKQEEPAPKAPAKPAQPTAEPEKQNPFATGKTAAS